MTVPLPDPRPPGWQELVEQQDLVIGRRQARLGGMSEDQWQWRLDSGRWRSVLHGVAVAHTGEVTERQRSWAAVVYAGADAYLSADAALVVHGMRLAATRTIHLACARQVRPQRFPRDEQGSVRVDVRRVAEAAALRHPARTPPVLRLAPAALHAAAWAGSDRAAEWRLAAVVQQGLVSAADLRRAVGEMARLPRCALVRDVLDDVELGAHAASELDLLRFLRRHGLPLPDRLQRPVRASGLRYLDAWWERERVSAEMDGAHHRSVGTWEQDALRANDIQLVEQHDRILLLRFTRGHLRHDEARVAAQLRRALR